MSFSASVKLGTVGDSILNVKLQSCNIDCSNCTDLVGYTSVAVSSFPTSGLTVNNIPDGTKSIKVLALDNPCTDVIQCITISGIPGDPTPTPIPPTATPTPIPPTPTPTPIPSCGAPTITNVTRNGINDVDVSFTTPNGCVATHIEYSLDNVNWGSQNTSGCSSPRTITISPNNQGTVYVRMRQSCQGVNYSDYSNVFTLSAVSQPTATPTPIPPTPTPTPTIGDQCVVINYQYNTNSGLADGCGGYQRTDTTVRATLYDSVGGTPINATQNINIQLTGSTSDCLGNTAYSGGITINAGSSFGELTYTSLTYEPCPFDQQCGPVSMVVDGVSEITPIGITECVIPPTPTPTPTPTTISQTWTCNNGTCVEVFDGSGLYTSLQDCQANCQQTTFYCKDTELSPCIAQASPCTGGQIACGEFLAPA